MASATTRRQNLRLEPSAHRMRAHLPRQSLLPIWQASPDAGTGRRVAVFVWPVSTLGTRPGTGIGARVEVAHGGIPPTGAVDSTRGWRRAGGVPGQDRVGAGPAS